MDVFKYADDYDWLTDYQDPSTEYIYRIVEAKQSYYKEKIRVTDSFGKTIGFVYKETNRKKVGIQ